MSLWHLSDLQQTGGILAIRLCTRGHSFALTLALGCLRSLASLWLLAPGCTSWLLTTRFTYHTTADSSLLAPESCAH
ncbi:hypothetical protein V8C86DRAFT_2761053 [Haematococcus lacustris]